MHGWSIETPLRMPLLSKVTQSSILKSNPLPQKQEKMSRVQDKVFNYSCLDESCTDAIYQSFKEVMCKLFWGSLQSMELVSFQLEVNRLSSISPDTWSIIIGDMPEFQTNIAEWERMHSITWQDPLQCKRSLFENWSSVYNCITYCPCNWRIWGHSGKFLFINGYPEPEMPSNRSVSRWNCKEVLGKLPLLWDPRSIVNFFWRNTQSMTVHMITNAIIKYAYL